MKGREILRSHNDLNTIDNNTVLAKIFSASMSYRIHVWEFKIFGFEINFEF
jgi:hypothetical protein